MEKREDGLEKGIGGKKNERRDRVVIGVSIFFQAEDGIRDLVRSRGLGDVYKGQPQLSPSIFPYTSQALFLQDAKFRITCPLYTYDAADDLLRVDLGGRRTIKKIKSFSNHSLLINFLSLLPL